MAILKKIDKIRRRLMRGLTKNVGNRYHVPSSVKNGKVEIKSVLISRPNHRLGNLLMITPLLQELTTTFPNCKIDLFVKGGLPSVIFGNYDNIDRIISLPKKHFDHLPSYFYSWFGLKRKKYDLVINIDKNSSSGRLSTQLATGAYKIFEDVDAEGQSKNGAYEHMAKYPVLNLRDFLGAIGHERNEAPIPPLNLKLSLSEIDAAKKILEEIVHNGKKTICIFTYATGSKCYSKSWWAAFYDALKTAFPSHTIVEVLPKENVSQIGFEAPTFYSRDIREICAFIANTEIFIGADSGMVHLASASPTPVIGLFSVTNSNKYGPYGPNSMAVDTNKVSTAACVEIINRILLK